MPEWLWWPIKFIEWIYKDPVPGAEGPSSIKVLLLGGVPLAIVWVLGSIAACTIRYHKKEGADWLSIGVAIMQGLVWFVGYPIVLAILWFGSIPALGYYAFWQWCKHKYNPVPKDPDLLVAERVVEELLTSKGVEYVTRHRRSTNPRFQIL